MAFQNKALLYFISREIETSSLELVEQLYGP